MAVYKRYGTSNEVKMRADFTMTKEWFCELLHVEENAFIYILDEHGNTLTTMLGEDSEFLPPGEGAYMIKTAGDIEKATTNNSGMNGLETMWRCIKRNSGRFPLNIGTLDSYIAGEIMKKISENGTSNYVSKHFRSSTIFVTSTTDGVAEKIRRRDFPHSEVKELSHLRSFILRGVKINQQNRESFTTLRLEEVGKISEAVIESKIRFEETLYMTNCVVDELLVAFEVLRPKRAVMWVNSLDSNNQRIDYGIEKLYNVTTTHLPEELMLVAGHFNYRRLFPLIGQFSVFQAKVADLHNFWNDHFLFVILEAFGSGDSLGKNRIAMFIYQGELDDFTFSVNRPSYMVWETEKTKQRRRGIVAAVDGRRLLILSHSLGSFVATVFATYAEDKEEVKQLDEKISNLIEGLDICLKR